MFDDDLPREKQPHFQPGDALDSLSVDELDAIILMLRGEITRLERAQREGGRAVRCRGCFLVSLILMVVRIADLVYACSGFCIQTDGMP